MTYAGLEPWLPTPMPRDPPDGTTAWSDEVGLSGEPRLMAWTVVQDDNATFDIHVLWDTPDLDAAMDAALEHAQAFFGPNLTGGVVIATLNAADNAVRRRFGPSGWPAGSPLSATRSGPAPNAGGGGYDVIGDIHGHVDRLIRLLRLLGYEKRQGAWRHPGGRTAVFVGDLVDRGPGQLETVRLVRAMVDAGSAQIVMGNHEFNAVAYATVDPVRLDYCRPHTEKNRNQHAEFIGAVDFDSAIHREMISWFREIPMWLDLGGLRVVHACWSQPHIDALAGRAGPGNTLTDELIVEGSTKGTDDHEAIEVILKGPEIPMRGIYYLDKDGHRRDEARMRWWDPQAETLRSAAHIPAGTQLFLADDTPIGQLPDQPFESPVDPYRHATPVLFGHYWWRKEDAEPVRPTTMCLDFSVAKGGVLRACRWDPGMTLDEAEYVDI